VGAVLVALAGPIAGLQAQAAANQAAQYGISDSVIVGQVNGRLFNLDVVNRRLYGAGNAIIEIDQRRVVARIADSTPGTSYFVPAEAQRGLTSTGIVFNPTTGAVGEHLPVHGDGIAYDPYTRRALLLGDTVQVVNLAPSAQAFPMMQSGRMGQGGMGRMNTPTNNRRDTVLRRLPPVRLTATIVGEIPLVAGAASGAADGQGRIYLALTARDTVVRVDVDKMKVVGGRPVAPCKAPSALAIDNVHARLFVGCDSEVVVLSLTDGHISGELATGGHPNEMAFDPGDGLLFVPAGDHGVVVVHEETPERYSIVQTISDSLVVGAAALVLDPTTHRVFVPHRSGDGTFRFTILSPQF
jgi:DNA-binding beta-propeller fold protein YncE